MKKLLLCCLLISVLTPKLSNAQDEILVEFATSDGSVSLMIPNGWEVLENLGSSPWVMITNKPNFYSWQNDPSSFGEHEFMIGVIVDPAENFLYNLPDDAIGWTFQQQALAAITQSVERSNGEIVLVRNKINFETLHEGEIIAIAEARYGDFAIIVIVRQIDDYFLTALGYTQQRGVDDLRRLMRRIVPTVLVDAASLRNETSPSAPLVESLPHGNEGNRFFAEGDPNLEIEVRDASVHTGFAPVNVSGMAIQTFKFQIRLPNSDNERGAWLDFSGLPVDIRPGTYRVDEIDPIIVHISVLDENGGYGGVPLVGTLTIESAGQSITGHFNLQTKPSDTYDFDVTTVTGTFVNIVVPQDHVRECIPYAGLLAGSASGQLTIMGGALIPVETTHPMWTVEPVGGALNVYLTDGAGFGEGSYLLLSGIRRDIASGMYTTSPFEITTLPGATLVEVTRGADGSLQTKYRALAGSIRVAFNDGLSGEVDLKLPGEEGTYIQSRFSDLRLPADDCR